MESRYRRAEYYGRRQVEIVSFQPLSYQDPARIAGITPHKTPLIERERYPSTTLMRIPIRVQPESKIGGIEQARKDDRPKPVAVRYANLSPSYEEDEAPDLPRRDD